MYPDDYVRAMRVVESTPMHQITVWSSGRPDLTDLVSLIEFLRKHDIAHLHIGSVERERGANGVSMTVEWSAPDVARRDAPDASYKDKIARVGGKLIERDPLGDAYYVGADGRLYDRHRRALP